jgi:hypothetical protein
LYQLFRIDPQVINKGRGRERREGEKERKKREAE